MFYNIFITRSLGALRAPTSRLRPFGPALGPSGLLDDTLIIQYNAAIRKEGGSPERDGGEEGEEGEGLVLEYSSSWK